MPSGMRARNRRPNPTIPQQITRILRTSRKKLMSRMPKSHSSAVRASSQPRPKRERAWLDEIANEKLNLCGAGAGGGGRQPCRVGEWYGREPLYFGTFTEFKNVLAVLPVSWAVSSAIMVAV